MLRMAQQELPAEGFAMRGADTVPLTLACRTVAKGAAQLAVHPESNDAEVKVQLAANSSQLTCDNRKWLVQAVLVRDLGCVYPAVSSFLLYAK